MNELTHEVKKALENMQYDSFHKYVYSFKPHENTLWKEIKIITEGIRNRIAPLKNCRANKRTPTKEKEKNWSTTSKYVLRKSEHLRERIHSVGNSTDGDNLNVHSVFSSDITN